jgi:hypothetical protein
MENNKTLLSQHIENVKDSLFLFFTPDKIKNDFFEGKESIVCPVHKYNNETYEMELTVHDEFTVLSFKMSFEYRGFSYTHIDVAVGGLDDSSGAPSAGKCYIYMEYINNSLAWHDCVLRDFY